MSSYMLEEWRDLGRVFLTSESRHGRETVAAEADFFAIGDLIMSRERFAAQLMDRDRLSIKDFNREYLLLERYESGIGRGAVGQIPARIDPNRLRSINMGQS